MHAPNTKEGIGKKYEQRIAYDVREKYHVAHNQRGFQVDTISDLGTHMGTLLLSCKLMHKCQASIIPAYVIQLTGRCEKGVFFNWSQYLVDEFLDNVHEA